MTQLEEFLLSRMTVRRWLLALLLVGFFGTICGWYVGHREATELSVAPAVPSPSPKQSQQYAVDAPSIATFNAFLAKFVPRMKEQIEAIHNTPYPVSATASDAENRERQSVVADLIKKVDCTLYSADLKKSDSLVNPIVGVALVNEMDSTTSKTTNYMNTTCYLCTITFAPGIDGKWQVIRATSKTTQVIAFPEDSRQMRDVGSEVDITLDWLKAAAADAQK